MRAPGVARLSGLPLPLVGKSKPPRGEAVFAGERLSLRGEGRLDGLRLLRLREQHEAEIGAEIVADLQNEPGILPVGRRDELGDLGVRLVRIGRRQLRSRIRAGRTRADAHAGAAERFDEGGAGKGRRVLDRESLHERRNARQRRLVADRNLALDDADGAVVRRDFELDLLWAARRERSSPPSGRRRLRSSAASRRLPAVPARSARWSRR